MNCCNCGGLPNRIRKMYETAFSECKSLQILYNYVNKVYALHIIWCSIFSFGFLIWWAVPYCFVQTRVNTQGTLRNWLVSIKCIKFKLFVMTQNIYANIIGRYKICFLQNDYNLPSLINNKYFAQFQLFFSSIKWRYLIVLFSLFRSSGATESLENFFSRKPIMDIIVAGL